MTESGDAEQPDWAEAIAKALAVGAGAAAGLPLGPPGLVGGAVAGALLEPVVVQLLQRVGIDGKRRSGEALAAAFEATGLPLKETLSRMSSDEQFRLLTGTAIIAAAHTAWEEKVQTLGRSLASGLIAVDEPEINVEELIMSAIADIEGPHLALLDLLVSWRPPRTSGEVDPVPLDISGYSYSRRHDRAWDVGWRKWYLEEIRQHRPRLAKVFTGLIGTPQRHGLAAYETNASDVIKKLSYTFQKDVNRLEQQQRTGRRRSRPAAAGIVQPVTGTWEPTEFGEEVWLRFRAAGAKVPDVWARVLETFLTWLHMARTVRRRVGTKVDGSAFRVCHVCVPDTSLTIFGSIPASTGRELLS